LTNQPINQSTNISIFLILLFHFSGFIGMCYTRHTQWFLDNTPLNLMVAFAGIMVSIPNKTRQFYIFSLFVAVFGWLVEYIGITTFLPFGKYDYHDSILGVQFLGVPLLLGANWWLQVYGYGTMAEFVFTKVNILEKTFTKNNILIKSLFAAFLMVLSDIPMEILSNKIGLWYWHDGTAPFQNYVGWFVYGFFLQYLGHYFKIFEQNKVAIVYCIVTTAFFWGLVWQLK
jgi:bisanhydrobacterioruberin hydratase